MYLVAECKTISAPKFNGFCSIGVANVLSTTTNIFFCCLTTLLISSMFIISIRGLDGLSIHMIFV